MKLQKFGAFLDKVLEPVEVSRSMTKTPVLISVPRKYRNEYTGEVTELDPECYELQVINHNVMKADLEKLAGKVCWFTCDLRGFSWEGKEDGETKFGMSLTLLKVEEIKDEKTTTD